ncbi:PREDICTED: pre-mRNA-processing protein 40C-like isoform X3 [Populus euphratica]|uniref:Pre-mRNA-processing protein 40C-like isoform X3 n=1 Tax=Populus euphratica TaxID=75702 RepID=A0AAJ6XFD8_POPEU|nr:PREDICTED: pre-mRNA-processing protein 40C-like isoform X3 [Populus euphratica]
MTQPPVAVDSLPSGVQRPIMPTMPPSNAVQQQTYPTYPSLPAMAASPQASGCIPHPWEVQITCFLLLQFISCQVLQGCRQNYLLELASWTESKPRLEKDPQGRATNPDLDPSDIENLFREHIKMPHERCTNVFKDLLPEVIIGEAAAQKTEDGKTVLDSWSPAKRLLKPDPRYNKMPRKERETLWRRYAEEMLRKKKSSPDWKEDRHTDAKNRSSNDSLQSGSRTHDRG